MMTIAHFFSLYVGATVTEYRLCKVEIMYVYINICMQNYFYFTFSVSVSCSEPALV